VGAPLQAAVALARYPTYIFSLSLSLSPSPAAGLDAVQRATVGLERARQGHGAAAHPRRLYIPEVGQSRCPFLYRK
jgi:hypothetical protein